MKRVKVGTSQDLNQFLVKEQNSIEMRGHNCVIKVTREWVIENLEELVINMIVKN